MIEKCPKCGAPICINERSNADSPSHYHAREREWLFGGWSPDSDLYCLERQVEALEAVVSKLSKTGDGVPIVPHMMLWIVSELDILLSGEARMFLSNGKIVTSAFTEEPAKCYSTREAAQASKTKGE